MRHCLTLAILTACLLTPLSARAATPEEDEATLRDAKVPTDADSLVSFFKKRILPENDLDKVKALIAQLGDDRFLVRELASESLVNMGPGIAKTLKDARGSADPEVAARIKEALEIVERTSTEPLLSAAARLLGQRKHPETARVLLDYAPVADREEVLDAIRQALLNVAQKDGKPEAALTTTLTDGKPLKRALAAETLIRSGGIDVAAGRKMLADADGNVRLRVALALIDRNDKEAVPTLFAVLPNIKLQQAWLAEDVLCRLAGDKIPPVSLGDDENSRKTASAAWEKWYKENADTIDLKKLKEAPPFLGLTVMAYQDNFGQGRIKETDKEGKTRWEFQGVTMPVTDLQPLPNGNVMICERNAGRVSERNKKGEIVWQKAAQQPVGVQRLVNGNTVIVTQNNAIEYNAQGKEVFTYNRGRFDIWAGKKHRNGEYILMTQSNIIRINAKGEEAGTWAIGRNYSYTSFDILPNGNILVPLTRNSRVVEYTIDGKEVWSGNVNYPTGVQRLPNGNTLVTSMNYRTLTELDRTGKTVATTSVQGMPWSAIRR